MAFTLEQITTGVRQALYGREVREWIAQMGEWVYRWVGEQTATVQTALTTMKTLEEQARTSKSSAADSAAKAQQAYKDAAAEKTKAVTAITTEKQTSLDAINTAKTTALADINSSTETATAAARTATLKAESAETSSNLAKAAKENAQGSASAARASETASKGYLDQIKVIADGAQGWYATPLALKNAVPNGQNGWWAIVGSTDTIWVWDGDSGTQGAWTDTFTDTDLSNYYTKSDVDTKLNGKADSSHTHNSVKDSGNNSSNTTFAYSKSGLAYGNYSWLAGWNGYELRAVDKTQFAASSHTHNYAGSGSAGGTANSVNGFKIVAQTSDPGAGSSLATNTILLVYK